MSDLAIKAFAEERRIPFLVHFTRAENLKSIMERGILSRTRLSLEGIKAVINDIQRHDGRANASCISVSFPNSSMFYKLRESSPTAKWVVLMLDVSLLWERDCLFCRGNAARKDIARMDSDHLRGVEAFSRMFDNPECPDRSALALQSYDPTDVQAEVLVFGAVDVSYVKGIRFKSKQDFLGFDREWLSRYEGIASWDETLFYDRARARMSFPVRSI